MFKIMSKLLLAFFISLSLRTAKIQPNYDDYEIATGLNLPGIVLEMESERQNGAYYTNNYFGTDLKFYDDKLSIKCLTNYNEARGLNRQNFSGLYNFNDKLSAGLTADFDRWQDPKLGVELKYNYITVRYCGNDRYLLEVRPKLNFELSDNFSIEPTFVYTATEKNSFYQAKLKFMFKWLVR